MDKLELVSDKEDFEILVKDIKMAAVLSNPRPLPKSESPFYLTPILVPAHQLPPTVDLPKALNYIDK